MSSVPSVEKICSTLVLIPAKTLGRTRFWIAGAIVRVQTFCWPVTPSSAIPRSVSGIRATNARKATAFAYADRRFVA